MRFAPLLVLLAACGDDGNHSTIKDAPVNPSDDASIDAPPTNGKVRVTVTNPTANSVAYFQNSDSTVVATTPLDANGDASAMMNAGGFVTVVQPSGTDYTVATWADVKPGDHLLLGNASSAGVGFTMTAIVPVDTSHTLAGYQVSSSCGGGAAAQGTSTTTVTAELAFNHDCMHADVMVTGIDAFQHALSWFYVADELVAANGTLDYTTKLYAPTQVRNYQLINNPDPSSLITLNHQYTTDKGTIFATSSPVVMTLTNPANGSQQMPPLPQDASNLIVVTQNVGVNLRQLIEWSTDVDDYELNWGMNMLPQFASATPPVFDVAAHTINWTTTGAGAGGDYSGAGIAVTRGAMHWTWRAYGPSSGSRKLPVLPTDLADLNVVATDTTRVGFVGLARSPGDWDAARANIMQGPPSPSGTAGQILVNTYVAPPPAGLHRSRNRGW